MANFTGQNYVSTLNERHNDESDRERALEATAEAAVS